MLLKLIYRKACEKMGDLPDGLLLQEYIKQVNNFTILASCLSKVYNYIDRYYTMFNYFDKTLEVSQITFREIVFTNFRSKLQDALLNEISKYRENEDVNWDIVHKTFETFINFGYEKNVNLKKVGDKLQWTGDKNLQIDEEGDWM